MFCIKVSVLFSGIVSPGASKIETASKEFESLKDFKDDTGYIPYPKHEQQQVSPEEKVTAITYGHEKTSPLVEPSKDTMGAKDLKILPTESKRSKLTYKETGFLPEEIEHETTKLELEEIGTVPKTILHDVRKGLDISTKEYQTLKRPEPEPIEIKCLAKAEELSCIKLPEKPWKKIPTEGITAEFEFQKKQLKSGETEVSKVPATYTSDIFHSVVEKPITYGEPKSYKAKATSPAATDKHKELFGYKGQKIIEETEEIIKKDGLFHSVHAAPERDLPYTEEYERTHIAGFGESEVEKPVELVRKEVEIVSNKPLDEGMMVDSKLEVSHFKITLQPDESYKTHKILQQEHLEEHYDNYLPSTIIEERGISPRDITVDVTFDQLPQSEAETEVRNEGVKKHFSSFFQAYEEEKQSQFEDRVPQPHPELELNKLEDIPYQKLPKSEKKVAVESSALGGETEESPFFAAVYEELPSYTTLSAESKITSTGPEQEDQGKYQPDFSEHFDEPYSESLIRDEEIPEESLVSSSCSEKPVKEPRTSMEEESAVSYFGKKICNASESEVFQGNEVAIERKEHPGDLFTKFVLERNIEVCDQPPIKLPTVQNVDYIPGTIEYLKGSTPRPDEKEEQSASNLPIHEEPVLERLETEQEPAEPHSQSAAETEVKVSTEVPTVLSPLKSEKSGSGIKYEELLVTQGEHQRIKEFTSQMPEKALTTTELPLYKEQASGWAETEQQSVEPFSEAVVGRDEDLSQEIQTTSTPAKSTTEIQKIEAAEETTTYGQGVGKIEPEVRCGGTTVQTSIEKKFEKPEREVEKTVEISISGKDDRIFEKVHFRKVNEQISSTQQETIQKEAETSKEFSDVPYSATNVYERVSDEEPATTSISLAQEDFIRPSIIPEKTFFPSKPFEDVMNLPKTVECSTKLQLYDEKETAQTELRKGITEPYSESVLMVCEDVCQTTSLSKTFPEEKSELTTAKRTTEEVLSTEMNEGVSDALQKAYVPTTPLEQEHFGSLTGSQVVSIYGLEESVLDKHSELPHEILQVGAETERYNEEAPSKSISSEGSSKVPKLKKNDFYDSEMQQDEEETSWLDKRQEISEKSPEILESSTAEPAVTSIFIQQRDKQPEEIVPPMVRPIETSKITKEFEKIRYSTTTATSDESLPKQVELMHKPVQEHPEVRSEEQIMSNQIPISIPVIEEKSEIISSSMTFEKVRSKPDVSSPTTERAESAFIEFREDIEASASDRESKLRYEHSDARPEQWSKEELIQVIPYPSSISEEKRDLEEETVCLAEKPPLNLERKDEFSAISEREKEEIVDRAIDDLILDEQLGGTLTKIADSQSELLPDNFTSSYPRDHTAERQLFDSVPPVFGTSDEQPLKLAEKGELTSSESSADTTIIVKSSEDGKTSPIVQFTETKAVAPEMTTTIQKAPEEAQISLYEDKKGERYEPDEEYYKKNYFLEEPEVSYEVLDTPLPITGEIQNVYLTSQKPTDNELILETKNGNNALFGAPKIDIYAKSSDEKVFEPSTEETLKMEEELCEEPILLYDQHEQGVADTKLKATLVFNEPTGVLSEEPVSTKTRTSEEVTMELAEPKKTLKEIFSKTDENLYPAVETERESAVLEENEFVASQQYEDGKKDFPHAKIKLTKKEENEPEFYSETKGTGRSDADSTSSEQLESGFILPSDAEFHYPSESQEFLMTEKELCTVTGPTSSSTGPDEQTRVSKAGGAKLENVKATSEIVRRQQLEEATELQSSTTSDLADFDRVIYMPKAKADELVNYINEQIEKAKEEDERDEQLYHFSQMHEYRGALAKERLSETIDSLEAFESELSVSASPENAPPHFETDNASHLESDVQSQVDGLKKSTLLSEEFTTPTPPSSPISTGKREPSEDQKYFEPGARPKKQVVTDSTGDLDETEEYSKMVRKKFSYPGECNQKNAERDFLQRDITDEETGTTAKQGEESSWLKEQVVDIAKKTGLVATGIALAPVVAATYTVTSAYRGVMETFKGQEQHEVKTGAEEEIQPKKWESSGGDADVSNLEKKVITYFPLYID